MRYLKLLLISLVLVAVLTGCTVSGTITLGSRGTVYGYVKGYSGYPIEGASVYIVGEGRGYYSPRWVI